MLGLDPGPWLLHPLEAVVNKGSVAEAFIGQELLAYHSLWAKKELFYWQRDAPSSSAEVDYLLEREGAVFPLEVKSGKSGTLKSLRLFLSEKSGTVTQGYRFSHHPFSICDNLHTYPLFAVPCIFQDLPRDWM